MKGRGWVADDNAPGTLWRLLIGRDYVMAHYRESITIREVAQVAALSPNRLIQHYREAFGRTAINHVILGDPMILPAPKPPAYSQRVSLRV